MFRYLTALSMLCGMVGLIEADPIKKAPKVETDKIAKECAESFHKALLNGQSDDGLKLMATPFRGLHGQKQESLDQFKDEFERASRARIDIKLGDPIELNKLNEHLKKNKEKELAEKTIKDYGDYIGQDGRIIVMIVTNQNGNPPLTRHLLVRVNDGQAKIVGACSVGE